MAETNHLDDIQVRPPTWIGSYQAAVERNQASTLIEDDLYKPSGYGGHVPHSQEYYGKTVGQVAR